MTETSFPPIQQRLMEFIRKTFRPGYNHYNVSKLIGDASSRQYFRYLTESDETFIVAAYPESFDPDQFTYRQIYDLLSRIGLPVPEIIRMDGSLGIVLQEDLGDLSLQRCLLGARAAERKALLRQAIDHLVVLQKEGLKALKPEYEASCLAFDEEKLNWELHFFRRHYLGNYRKLQVGQEARLAEEFTRLARELATVPRYLCHRDYHVRNLMLKEKRLYIIDFQDARQGPPSYDLVSLLKDSIELKPSEVKEHIGYYLRRAHSEGLSFLGESGEEGFQRQFHLMAIQRLLKALGTYGYQIIVRGNFIYEQYMAGSLHRALLSLQAVPEFPYIGAILEGEIERLRAAGSRRQESGDGSQKKEGTGVKLG